MEISGKWRGENSDASAATSLNECRESRLRAWEMRLAAYEQRLKAWAHELRSGNGKQADHPGAFSCDVDLHLGGRSHRKRTEEEVDLGGSLSEPSTSSQTPRVQSRPHSVEDAFGLSSLLQVDVDAAFSSSSLVSPPDQDDADADADADAREEGSQSGVSASADNNADVYTPRCIATPTDTPWSTPRGKHDTTGSSSSPKDDGGSRQFAWAAGPAMADNHSAAQAIAVAAQPTSVLATAPASLVAHSARHTAASLEASSKSARDCQGLQQTGAERCIAWYRVAFCGGISVRERPSVTAPATGLVLPCGVVFGVSAAARANDERLYLKLACGRGWVFDDSHLMPSDPSVTFVRSGDEQPALDRSIADYTASLPGAAWGQTYGGAPADAQYYEDSSQQIDRARRYLTRGCRGGARRNKNKKLVEKPAR